MSEIRQGRFGTVVSIGKSSNTVAVFAQSPLILKYFHQTQSLKLNQETQAIKGIIIYGKKNKCQQQAFQLADTLQKALLSKNPKIIGECCINLYTRETFLYKDINKYLRNAQFQNAGSTTVHSNYYEAVKELLPFCLLLNKYVKEWTYSSYKGIVYRGCTLNNQQIQEYIENIGEHRQWNAFTSTTKSKKKAQKFGNTLFIIKLGQHYGSYGYQFGLQIQNFSQFPGEEEVLLFAGMQILVEKVEKMDNKTEITLFCTDLGP